MFVFLGELHRISVCYGSGKGDDDTFTFSDDQSSGQVLDSVHFLDLLSVCVVSLIRPFISWLSVSEGNKMEKL